MTERFEQQRARLRGVAYRMLGSVGDADPSRPVTRCRPLNPALSHISVTLHISIRTRDPNHPDW